MPNTGITGTEEVLGTKIHAAIKTHMRSSYGDSVNLSDPNVVDEVARQMWVHVAKEIIDHITSFAFVQIGSPADPTATVPLPEAPSVLLNIPTHTHSVTPMLNVIK
jgi:hypothetical protein